ncbi:hypothetical protein GOP47_0003580 [Adiantum capillus-veneris]|uniref:TOM1-like protein 2 n=1 Tax=Adiantum capillus-veneris TaxID=13818 RepID=A0A9D4V7J9_ADICA|nr:hypothetical protein GOP47_0003580 [Adiantum capillus-veneris]
MADNLREKLASLSGKLKVGGAEVSKKVSTSMVTAGDKMKELFRVPTPADKLIEELTSEDPLLPQAGLDWARIMELCDSIRSREISGQEVVKALKKRLMVKATNSTVSLDTYTCSRIQLLTLTLIESCVKNCEHLFVDVANERLLDEMVKIVDDPSTSIVARDKALKLIEAWGESAPELRNLPMFEETYKSLKSRGVKFPLRDSESLAPIFTPPQTVAPSEKVHKVRRTYRDIVGDTQDDLALPPTEELIHTAQNSLDLLSTVLTTSPQQEAFQDELAGTLVEQCHQSQFMIQRIVERLNGNEALLFEALNLNDELQKVIAKYEEMRASVVAENAPPTRSSTSLQAEDIKSA